MVTSVFLIRHCQSTGNIQHRFQGRFDAEVSPDGVKQLALLGLRFRNEPIDIIYTSPLKRARATAEAIAQYHPDTPLVEEPGFIELDCGRMENLLLTEVAERFPQVARDWDEAPELCRFPGGEAMAQVYERVNAALDRVIQDNPGKRIVITTHGGVLRNLYARVSRGCPEGIRQSQVFGNTGVSLLEARDGALSWAYTNDLSHLPEDMRRPPTRFAFFAGQRGNQEDRLV